tara:strand:- start:459 stop:707 length:249 start_codon:yes stop_codon:yes gene_type:complete
MRNYNIKKFKGNTHYSVRVVDTYGREEGNFFRDLQDCYKFVYEIWDNEQPLTNEEIEQNLLSSAIANCIEIDKANNINLNLD